MSKLHDYQKHMIQSGLNWKVDKRPLFDEKGTKLPLLGTFRSDNDRFLGPVGENYRVIQNEEVFQLPDALISSGMEVQYARGGTLKGGAGIYAEFNLPKFEVDVLKVGDTVRLSLLVRTMHNGTGSLHYRLQAMRLVCTNGMVAGRTQQLAFVRHTASADERIRDVKQMIAHSATEAQTFSKVVNALARVQLNTEQIGEAVQAIYYKDDTHNLLTSAVRQNQARDVLGIFEANDNDTFKKQRGTAWNLLNAFTNYADHRMSYRQSEDDENEESAAIRGKLFGVGEALKTRALVSIARVVAKHHSVDIPEAYLAAL